MTPLATLEQLLARLGSPVDDDDIDRMAALLVDASAAVRNYTGQQFTEGTSTAKILRPKNGVVRLPQRPVTAVTAVTDMNTPANDVTYTWDGLDRLSVAGNVLDSWSWEPYRNGITQVVVTYEHGYETIPDDIVGVVCQIAARALGREPEEAGITQEAIAGYSYSIGTAAASGPFGMLPDEKRILDGYSFPRIGTISIGLR